MRALIFASIVILAVQAGFNVGFSNGEFKGQASRNGNTVNVGASKGDFNAGFKHGRFGLDVEDNHGKFGLHFGGGNVEFLAEGEEGEEGFEGEEGEEGGEDFFDFALEFDDISSASGQCAGVIKNHEGYVPNFYKDSRGYGTICWGHLYTQGHSGETFTQSQCQSFFNSDYATAYNGAKTLVSNFNSLAPARQCVLVDMTYNLGLAGIRSFHTFLGMVQSGNYAGAASDMMGTAWAGQVGRRASNDSQMMSSGSY